jgi:hypothetical protein
MKSLCLAMLASLTLQSMAYAAIGQNVGAQNYTRLQPDQTSIAHSAGPQTLEHIVHNGNECAADHADPVWSATATLLGYTCSHNENGG